MDIEDRQEFGVNNLIPFFWLSSFDPWDNGIAIIGAQLRYISVAVGFRTGIVSPLSRVRARDTESSISPRHFSLPFDKQRVYRVTVRFITGQNDADMPMSGVTFRGSKRTAVKILGSRLYSVQPPSGCETVLPALLLSLV